MMHDPRPDIWWCYHPGAGNNLWVVKPTTHYHIILSTKQRINGNLSREGRKIYTKML